MATKKQILANEENAQMSTGPRSLNGKATSSQNSISHGLFSRHTFLPGENEDELQSLSETIRQDLKPTPGIEEILVERIIANTWRLKRMYRVESGIYNKKDAFDITAIINKRNGAEETEIGADDSKLAHAFLHGTGINSVFRMETTLERSIYKAIHELQRIQAMRCGMSVQLPLAVDLDVSFKK